MVTCAADELLLRSCDSSSTWPVLDALLESPKILRVKIIQREKFKHERSKAIQGWVLQTDPAFTVLQVHCLQGTFDESQLSDVTPVSWTSVPVPWNGRCSQAFWKVDSTLQWYQYYKGASHLFNSESYSIVNYSCVKLDLPLCRPCKVLHMLSFTVNSHPYYKDSGVI